MVLLCLAAGLSGCVTVSGSNYSTVVQKAGAPAAGMSRVVLYPADAAATLPLQLDGVMLGEIKVGTFMYRDVPPGSHEIVAESYQKLHRYSFATVAGRTHYIKIDASDAFKIRQQAALRALATGGYTYVPPEGREPTLFKIIPMSEAAATSDLRDRILASP